MELTQDGLRLVAESERMRVVFEAGRLVELRDKARNGESLAGAGDVRIPMLLLHGADDPLCAAYGSRTFFEQLRTEGSDLRIYPELRHEIFNEPEQESVFADLLEWTSKLGGVG